MGEHENQAIRFLKSQKERLEGEMNELKSREDELHASLAANADAQAEKQSAMKDIDRLLDVIQSSAE